jgi:hypothetical protein
MILLAAEAGSSYEPRPGQEKAAHKERPEVWGGNAPKGLRDGDTIAVPQCISRLGGRGKQPAKSHHPSE